MEGSQKKPDWYMYMSMQQLCNFCNISLVVLQPDSGFFCEGYSSDDDVVLKEEFRGTIVKQGCLLKQVSIAHVPSCH